MIGILLATVVTQVELKLWKLEYVPKESAQKVDPENVPSGTQTYYLSTMSPAL